MKRIFCVILATALVMLSALSCSAAEAELTAEGKTVVEYEDWIVEKIENDTRWNLASYVGTEQEVIVPRFINGLIVISMDDHCFANNTTVKSIITSSPMWTIGEYAFIDCTALENFECNYGMQTIKTGAFTGTAALKSINLETSVITEVMPYTFLNSGIEVITLPGTCTKLGEYSFAQCSGLRKIVIPDSVVEIADTAFSSDDSLVIYCNTGSYAHEYAVANEIPFVLLDAPVEYTFILGDADGDGIVTIMDATRIQRVLADLVEDTDGLIALRAANGEALSIMHATRVQRWLVDYEVSAPIGTTVTSSIPYYLIF